MLKAVLAAAAVAAIAVVPAHAKPVVKTTYRYYGVSGSTARDIYHSMVSRGPNVNGMDAYASTNATSAQSGRLVQAKACSVSGYRFTFDFTINLPKLRNEGALTGATRDKWQSFSAFLRRHEEQHTRIWMACAADLERQVTALRRSSCGAVDKEANRLWGAMRKSCEKRHRAFDAAEQRRVLQQPFVRMVFQRSGNGTSALAVPKRKK